MKEQIRYLRELQTIDARTEEIRRLIVVLPEKLKPAKQDLARLQALLDGEKKKLSDTETWRKEQEELIRIDTEGVKSAKVKLAAAKSAREFAMANREIDHKRRAISSREEEVLKVIEAMETTKTALEAQSTQVAEIAEKVDAEETTIDAQIAELNSRASTSTEGRDEIKAKIEKTLLAKYESVLKRRGVAVVPVVKGACAGCHMQVPPQLNNILAGGDSIETCPTCYRLLYHASLIEDEVAQ